MAKCMLWPKPFHLASWPLWVNAFLSIPNKWLWQGLPFIAVNSLATVDWFKSEQLTQARRIRLLLWDCGAGKDM